MEKPPDPKTPLPAFDEPWVEISVMIGKTVFEREGPVSEIADEISVFLGNAFPAHKVPSGTQAMILMEISQQFARARQAHELIKAIQNRVKNGWKPGDPTNDQPTAT